MRRMRLLLFSLLATSLFGCDDSPIVTVSDQTEIVMSFVEISGQSPKTIEGILSISNNSDFSICIPVPSMIDPRVFVVRDQDNARALEKREDFVPALGSRPIRELKELSPGSTIDFSFSIDLSTKTRLEVPGVGDLPIENGKYRLQYGLYVYFCDALSDPTQTPASGAVFPTGNSEGNGLILQTTSTEAYSLF